MFIIVVIKYRILTQNYENSKMVMFGRMQEFVESLKNVDRKYKFDVTEEFSLFTFRTFGV